MRLNHVIIDNNFIDISIHALQTECDPCAPHTTLSSFCYFYPRTPNGVRLEYRVYISTTDTISIHALQTECDKILLLLHTAIRISIHALQTECDKQPELNSNVDAIFLSTHSKRSATIFLKALLQDFFHFYPRTPNGVRQYLDLRKQGVDAISIHALQTECDRRRSTATQERTISIHALQTECDLLHINKIILHSKDFYPRTPNGVRLEDHFQIQHGH